LPHAAAGEALLLINGIPASIASIIGAHHGRPWENGTGVSDDIKELLEESEDEIYRNFSYGLRLWGNRKRRPAWLNVQKDFFDWVWELEGYSFMSDIPEISDSCAVILSGLLVMADWLSSNVDYFPLFRYGEVIPDDISLRETTGISRIKLPPVWKPSPTPDGFKLTQERFGFLPNDVQNAVIEAVTGSTDPGLLILEAPMGIGKTEAALLAAEEFPEKRVSGMVFALPTQATANGIFSRVIDWGKGQTAENILSIRLAHGMASLNEEYSYLLGKGRHVENIVDDYEEDRLEAHEFFGGSKQALLADFVVGTVDQVLLAALKQKHFMLRHLGLCGKVVIIDECHAYDAYMNEYLERALQWLGKYHAPVIMLSATLPYERREALVSAYLGYPKDNENGAWKKNIEYPLLTWTDGNQIRQKEINYTGDRRNVDIIRIPCCSGDEAQAEKIGDVLESDLKNGGCAAIVLNTVGRAQAFSNAIKKRFPEKRVLLLHSRFISEDRLKYEEALLQFAGKKSTKVDRDGLIIVGTQVIEQSLDFDVDLMVSDLCPMDLLLQRIGRLHRHPVHDAMRPAELKRAKCFVLGADGVLNKGGVSVYGEYLLMRTSGFLPDTMTLPDDIAPLVQKVYDETYKLGNEPDGYEEALKKETNNRAEMKQSADTFRLTAPGKYKTINEFLGTDILTDEDHAIAQVRNGESSHDVLVLFKTAAGLSRMPWVYSDRFDAETCPDDSLCRAISGQRLRLPSWILWDDVKDEMKMPEHWSQSIWLKNQALLVLDLEGKKTIGKYIISYTKERGLSVERRNEKENE